MIFLCWFLGKEITYPFLREYATARKCTKPLLVFLKRCERTPAAQTFVEKICKEVKYAEFNAATDLDQQIWRAVATLLIDGVRQYKLTANDITVLTVFLAQLPKVDLEYLREGSELQAVDSSKQGHVELALAEGKVVPSQLDGAVFLPKR